MPRKRTPPRPAPRPKRREAPAEHGTAEELGAKAGVSARRIRQLRDEGVLTARRRGRRWVFPLAASLEALKAHRLTGNHGGARQGAGRPSAKAKARADQAARSIPPPPPPPEGPPAPEPRAPVRPAPAGVAVDHAAALTRAQADTRERQADAEIKLIRLARLRNQLIPIDDARAAWGERVRLAREVLDALAEQLAADVCSRLRIDDADRNAVEEIARDRVGVVLEQLASLRFDPDPEPPAAASAA